jgi:hypothetical protein
LSFDDVFARIDADLLVQDAGDRPFLRYVSLANRLNQGLCPEDLADDRAALIKAVNSLSTESTITVPEAIDADQVIYRVDLRDFGWDQPATVDGVSFTDKWEAIVAASPFAVEFAGDQADQVELQTTTKLPLIFSDALIDEATVGNLYYALIGIGATEDELLAQLGIDEDAQEEQKIVIRAGTSHSILSPQDVVAERLQVEAFQGYYWSRYDLASSTGGQSIFANPLNFKEDSIAAVFSLRNGLNGYALFDAAGTRLTDTNVLLDGTEPDGEAENSVSCSQCHAAGLNPISDEVRAFAQANSRQFDADTFGEILDSFPIQTELDAVIQRDSAQYASALSRAGLQPSGVDPIHTAYARFDGDVTLPVAAAELGVRADDLSRELVFLSSRVDARLAVLATGGLSRADFEELYLPTLCALQISNENQPAAAACAAVGQ